MSIRLINAVGAWLVFATFICAQEEQAATIHCTLNPKDNGSSQPAGTSFLWIDQVDGKKPLSDANPSDEKVPSSRIVNFPIVLNSDILPYRIIHSNDRIRLQNGAEMAVAPAHNAIRSAGWSEVVPANGELLVRLDKSESLPITVTLPSQGGATLGYLLQNNSSLAFVTDANGDVKVDKLPVGELRFRLWNGSHKVLSPVVYDNTGDKTKTAINLHFRAAAIPKD